MFWVRSVFLGFCQVSINNAATGKSEAIAGKQPFVVKVFPSYLYSAFTASNISVIAGQKFSAALHGRDKFGNLVIEGNNVVLAMLLGSVNASNGLEISTSAVFVGGGLFDARFEITRSGLYELLLKIDSETPQKNPFSIICSPQQNANPSSSGLPAVQVGNSTQLLGQDSTAGTTGVWVLLFC